VPLQLLLPLPHCNRLIDHRRRRCKRSIAAVAVAPSPLQHCHCCPCSCAPVPLPLQLLLPQSSHPIAINRLPPLQTINRCRRRCPVAVATLSLLPPYPIAPLQLLLILLLLLLEYHEGHPTPFDCTPWGSCGRHCCGFR
jgi:hypothetical protein